MNLGRKRRLLRFLQRKRANYDLDHQRGVLYGRGGVYFSKSGLLGSWGGRITIPGGSMKRTDGVKGKNERI